MEDTHTSSAHVCDQLMGVVQEMNSTAQPLNLQLFSEKEWLLHPCGVPEQTAVTLVKSHVHP
jgi:hypothetical protein